MNYVETLIVLVILGVVLAMIAGAGATEHKMALELTREAAAHEEELKQLLALTP